MRLGERCLIADRAFAGSEITVFEHYAGDGDLIVGDRAFSDCKKLTSIKLGDTEIIGNYAINSERDFRKTQQKISNNIENSLQMIA